MTINLTLVQRRGNVLTFQVGAPTVIQMPGPPGEGYELVRFRPGDVFRIVLEPDPNEIRQSSLAPTVLQA